MTLSSVYTIVGSAFASTAEQSTIIARNIANVDTPGYVRELANQITNEYGGSDVISISRQANAALLHQLASATSDSSAQTALANGIAALAQTINDSASSSSAAGALQNGNSPAAMIGNLESALATYETNPSSGPLADDVLSAAQGLTSALNTGSQSVSQVEEQADQNMASAVSQVNSLLGQFQQVNTTIVTGLANGADISNAEDQRDAILTNLSQLVGISTTTGANGSTSIYTDSGVTLFQNIPQSVTFQPTSTYVPGVTGNAVMVDGVPITGAGAPMAIQSGALAGYAELRDSAAPQYQAQLDQIAGGLVTAFGESDQSNPPTLPTLAGLFTAPGMTTIPTSGSYQGLAASIEINSNVDPSQGGNALLLRDGGISSPGNPAYTYNTTGDPGFTGRIQQLITGLSATQSFDATAGLGASASVTTLASSSVGWLQSANQSATDTANYQSSLLSQASAALSNTTGVNLDTEMTNMLNIENSYTSSAKLLTTVSSMFSALLNAA